MNKLNGSDFLMEAFKNDIDYWFVKSTSHMVNYELRSQLRLLLYDVVANTKWDIYRAAQKIVSHILLTRFLQRNQ